VPSSDSTPLLQRPKSLLQPIGVLRPVNWLGASVSWRASLHWTRGGRQGANFTTITWLYEAFRLLGNASDLPLNAFQEHRTHTSHHRTASPGKWISPRKPKAPTISRKATHQLLTPPKR
jgi:hypothetical protein